MNDYTSYLEELEDEVYRKPRRKPKQSRADVISALIEQRDDTREGFNPSFSSSRHERAWILSYLGPFYEDHLITDVLRQVKGGKEATVYCCAADEATGVELVAAKVYRPRMFRNLRNDARYREGRDVMDDRGRAVRGRRELTAMKKKSGFGQELLHSAWLSNEYTTLAMLHKAGADVPRPLAESENVILMEFVGEELSPAPPLSQIALPEGEAPVLFKRVLDNIELMLANGKIHADLSAHNILYWEGGVKIIDFPQAVDPYKNPHAWTLFTRDVTRVCQYFQRAGVPSNPQTVASDIWTRCIPT